ncbi:MULTISPECIES: ketopantoate reductase family protein [Sporolactobacillus]|uniref:2-dehydropantoate 2-reductase n=2 Tax=Sporolactobacillus TaxID=2077 RepID=A0A4Y1ZH61_9BACL|nr:MULTISPECIES: ketopantoate reductase family protein [Sporolactobacillus]QAA21715.1 ketopantoate reductase family protein [Sporolactobacillus terrae]QAA24687.1 ketopantoate reductase family protein [Sporolactobacillus terrae]UAK16522.1 ketopantoate reductase family protein [Sporolactobacillus terrae]GAY78281.1 2-dehydropantoate 2-reductase [Sporolactobacillus inulinus]GEB76275.1 2-dehydropantoate 2-reductase [Sporolactobacillus inulinus]
MKIAVIGAGAMGLRYGILLQEVGNDVDFVEPWAPSYQAICKQGGVQVSRDHQNQHLVPVDVYRPDEYTQTPDLVILFTKQMQSEEAMVACRHFIGEKTYVLTNQNGIGSVDVIRRYVPNERIIAGIALIATVLDAPGKVDFMGAKGAGHTQLVNVTEKPDDFTDEVVREFERAGMNPTLQTNYLGTLWGKLLMNSVINTLCTLMDITMGEYVAYSGADDLSRRLIDEGYAAGVADGVRFMQSREEMLQIIDHESSQVNPLHHPSMYQDMVNGRPTEVDYINGHIVKTAKKHGLEAKSHEMLVNLLHLAESAKQLKMAH